MVKFRILSLVLVVLGLLSGCGTSTKIQAIKPEAESNKDFAYTAKTSYLGMPVSIEILDIQHVLNKNIKQLIYTDSILDDDNLEVKIWKTNTITLTQDKDKIRTIVPIKIWLKYKYGTEFMGLNDTREFNLNGTISVLSSVSLSNWQLKTKSVIEKIDWIESPSIQIAGKNVAITYLVNPALSWFKTDIAKQLDELITKTCDFKPQVLDAIKAISTPYLVNDKFETWFSINPIELYATDASIVKGKVIMDLGMKATLRTIIGDKPAEKINWNQLKITKVKSIPNHFNGTIAALSNYKSASRIVTNNFKGETFTSGKKKVTIDHVEMWQKKEKIIIALSMNGTLNGTIYLSGIPKFNAEKQEIFFENLDYVLDTKNVLHKSASWLLNGVILKKIHENCRYSIANDIANGKETLKEFLSNYSPIKGVYVNGKLENLTFEKFDLLNNGIVSFINTTGNVSITINGLE